MATKIAGTIYSTNGTGPLVRVCLCLIQLIGAVEALLTGKVSLVLNYESAKALHDQVDAARRP